jgi:F0F1-type ATP synthase membrane subunit c/vacuolar-type H+-ATPase subunit K
MKFISRTQQPVTSALQSAIIIVAFACIAVGFLVPRFVFRAAESAYQSNSALPPLKRWMTKGILSLAFFEACILFGLVLQVLGAPLSRVELLFGAGIASMLFWSPGKPPGSENGEFPQA